MEKLIVGILSNPKMQELMLAMAQKIGAAVAEKLTALLPVIVAAATKSITDKLALPGVPVPDVAEVANTVREQVNKIPDIDIPILSDIFDLTQWLKGHAG